MVSVIPSPPRNSTTGVVLRELPRGEPILGVRLAPGLMRSVAGWDLEALGGLGLIGGRGWTVVLSHYSEEGPGWSRGE